MELLADHNRWRINNQSHIFLECPSPAQPCMGNTSTGTCAPHFHGVMCSQCEDGYAGATCEECAHKVTAWTVIGLLGIAFFLVVLVTTLMALRVCTWGTVEGEAAGADMRCRGREGDWGGRARGRMRERGVERLAAETDFTWRTGSTSSWT